MEIKNVYPPEKANIMWYCLYVESFKKKNGTKELIYIMEIESQMQKTNLWLLGRKVGEDKEIGIDIYTLLYNGTPLQHSSLENSMDGGSWQAAVHGVMKNRTRLSDFTFTFHFHATHSSVLAWRIPGTGETGGLPSMGSQSQTRLKQVSSSSTLKNR